MTAEQAQKRILKIVGEFSRSQLEAFLEDVIHFSCVPRKCNSRDPCSHCELCWLHYVEYIQDKYDK